ncbi:MAG: VOC family protein [Sphingomonadales bacterium]|nr:VOC family protein [Sphingomonadales bacterium]
MQIKLLQPHDDTPSAYTEFLARMPQGRLHHLAYWVDDFAAVIARARREGVMLDVVRNSSTRRGSLRNLCRTRRAVRSSSGPTYAQGAG